MAACLEPGRRAPWVASRIASQLLTSGCPANKGRRYWARLASRLSSTSVFQFFRADTRTDSTTSDLVSGELAPSFSQRLVLVIIIVIIVVIATLAFAGAHETSAVALAGEAARVSKVNPAVILTFRRLRGRTTQLWS